jgi:hypothetical protein
VKAYYFDFVKRQENEDLHYVMDTYSRLGFPGCVGSIDCTHLWWAMCPVGKTNVCKGKGDHPTLVYEACVDHNRRLLGMTKSFYGTINDKTIVKLDDYVQAVKESRAHADVKFLVKFPDGEVVEKSGVYFLCDGGYHRWACLMSPFPRTGNEADKRWSEWLESVRKDVECFFGVLKSRFRWLRNPITLHYQSQIDNAVFLCCMLHNMLLQYDGLDRFASWEQEREFWDDLAPQERVHDADYDEAGVPLQNAMFHQWAEPMPNNCADVDFVTGEPIALEVEEGWFERHKFLVHHLNLKYEGRELQWPKHPNATMNVRDRFTVMNARTSC